MPFDPYLAPLFETPEIAQVLGASARLQAMLDFEAALARAEAETGVVPVAAVPAIGAACQAELYDQDAIAAATAIAGNPVIPMVEHLTRRVAESDADAARFVHWGATSQDVRDTAAVLQMRAALAPIEADLDRLCAALAALAERHKRTPVVGRSVLQHALPTTFGLKAAGWLDSMLRHREHLAEIRPRLLTLQFGGAVGTFAALGDKGLEVASALAHDLGLAMPTLCWHALRDRTAEFATVLALLIGSLGKIARDVALMMQTEIGEIAEPRIDGRGGSSTMAHKRNPVAAPVVIAIAMRAPNLAATMLAAMGQEHERGLGGWHTEWTVLPELAGLAAGALRNTALTMEGLEVDPARMRANLEATHGLIMAEAVTMALGTHIGRLDAHHRVKTACREAVESGRHLRDVLADDDEISAVLPGPDLVRLFEPEAYLGQADTMVERALIAWRHSRS